MTALLKACMEKFLSTPSARRATAQSTKTDPDPNDFYPRPPRGGRPCESYVQEFYSPISIHALREEGDKRHPVRSE